MTEVVQTLEFNVERIRSDSREVEEQAKKVQGRIHRALASHKWLIMAMRGRSIVDRTVVWRPGAVLIVATICGGLGTVFYPSMLLFLVGFVVGLGVTVFLLLYPTDVVVLKKTQEIESELPGLQTQRSDCSSRLQVLKALLDTETKRLELARVEAEREAIEATSSHRRGLLLAENWRAMRSVEFEKYLERVFLELGYGVETTRVTGDQGIDLIVSNRGKRIAIQVKGYLDSVSNSAVQEAFAGMAFYKCQGCAVITNSRFTRSAIELAESVNCKLVMEESLPKLVKGEIDLWEMCFAVPNSGTAAL